MQKTYNYKKSDYDKNGLNKNGKLFVDMINEWESEFHMEFKPLFATHCYANNSAMMLLKRCMHVKETEDFGYDDDFDFDTNLKIDEHSQRSTVYAIGSGAKGNEDEPLGLVLDEKIPDETVILKYIPDNDEDVEIEPDPSGSGYPVEEEEDSEITKNVHLVK